MATNFISINDADDRPGLLIAPDSAQASLRTSDGEDVVDIASNGGQDSIDAYTVNTAGGDDAVDFNGSAANASVLLGEGADTFSIRTLGFGGSLTASFIAGNAGNDVFELIDGDFVTNSTIDGGLGADLFRLEGTFDTVTVTGGGDDDVVRFEGAPQAGQSFVSSFVGLGAGTDLLTDEGVGVDFSASSLNGGGGSDTISLFNSSSGSDEDGVSITGGEGADYIYGTKSGENTILAGAGFDFIQVFKGDNTVIGGGGSDTLVLGEGDASANAGAGNDVVWGQDGRNTIDAGTGIDIVVGGLDKDKIFGGDGQFRDFLVGGEEDDTIDGGSGGDLIYGDDASASNYNGTFSQFNGDFDNFGSFTVLGINETNGSSVLGLVEKSSLAELTEYFVDGEDTAGWGPDWIGNDDEIDNDVRKFAFAPDTAPWNGQTSDEDDPILADGEGGYLIAIDDEADLANTLIVPGSSEIVVPEFRSEGRDPGDYDPDNAGNDKLFGNSGNDTIFGGGGDDAISGGLGNDVIIGGEGADVMTGGDGSDIFVQGIETSPTGNISASIAGDNWTFNWNGDEPDLITDFTAVTQGDRVVDRVAFQGGGLDTQNTIGSWGAANNDEHNVVDATGSAGLNIWEAGHIYIYRGTYTTGKFVTSISGEDVLAFGSPLGRASSQPFDDVLQLGTQAVVLEGAGGQNFQAANFYGGSAFDSAGSFIPLP